MYFIIKYVYVYIYIYIYVRSRAGGDPPLRGVINAPHHGFTSAPIMCTGSLPYSQ